MILSDPDDFRIKNHDFSGSTINCLVLVIEPSIDRERVQIGGQNDVQNHDFRRILHHFEDAKIHVDQYFLHDLERVFCMFFTGLWTRSRCIVGNFRENKYNTQEFQKRHF